MEYGDFLYDHEGGIRMEKEELKTILENHQKWLAAGSDGERANLRWANLSGANLRWANLRGADLCEADLRGAKNVTFLSFPSLNTISSPALGELSDELTLELMRRDAAAHPYPERFDEWKNGGSCPYQGVERWWLFDMKRELYKPGPPTMSDYELIVAICKDKGWGLPE